MKIPYSDEPPRRRGRKPGSKNRPGHKAGRPANGNQCGAECQTQDSFLPTGKDPGRPNTLSHRVAYDTPMPCTDGHHCPGNENGRGQAHVNNNPLPTPPAKPLPPAPSYGIIRAVAQAGENPDLITPEELIKEIQNIALSDIADWPVCPEHLRNAPEAFRRAVSSVKMYLEKDNKGQALFDQQGKPIYRFEITLWNKNAAHDQLSKWHGLYAKDKVAVNAQFNQFNQVNVNSGWDLTRLTEEELELLLSLRAKSGGEVLELERLGC